MRRIDWAPIWRRAHELVAEAGENLPSVGELWRMLVGEKLLPATSYKPFKASIHYARQTGAFAVALPSDSVKKGGWPERLALAKQIVESYDTRVSLRQLFYRLVAAGSLENTRAAYGELSNQTTRARESGEFPELLDATRTVYQPYSYTGIEDALDSVAASYQLDHTTGQKHAIYLCVEKSTLVEQLKAWFGEYGVRIVAFRGYSSHSLKEQIRSDVKQDGRPPVFIYSGDYDPTGLHIDQDFQDKLGYDVRRVAINKAQVEEYDLVPAVAKETDPRIARMRASEGDAMQVELEALDPTDLRRLYEAEFFKWFNKKAYKAVLKQEDADRTKIRELVEKLNGDGDWTEYEEDQ